MKLWKWIGSTVLVATVVGCERNIEQESPPPPVDLSEPAAPEQQPSEDVTPQQPKQQPEKEQKKKEKPV